MHVLGEVPIEDLIVGPVEVIALEHVNYFEHEDAAGFRVHSLLLHLVARDVRQELLLSLEISPNLVENLVRAEQVVDADLEGEQLLALLFDIVPLVEHDH